MGIYWDGIIAAVCVLGLALVVWWLFGRLLQPMPGQGAKVLLNGRGDGEKLEHIVHSLIWLRSLGLLRCPIVIVDIDLTPAGRELALHLAARWPDVILWPVSQLPDYFIPS